MFNIFEQPWLFLAGAVIALIVVYTITVDRKLYWLSLIVLLSSAVLHFLFETTLLSFMQPVIPILKIILSVGIVAATILIAINVIKPAERADRLWVLPLCLCFLAFGTDWLIKTDMENIRAIMNAGQKAFEQEDYNRLSSLVSENYRDSYHKDKQALLDHCRYYMSDPLFDKIIRTSTQIGKNGPEAIITFVVFVSFDDESMVYSSYGVTGVKVGAKITVRKEADKSWKITKVDILEVNNQPFSWRDVRDYSL